MKAFLFPPAARSFVLASLALLLSWAAAGAAAQQVALSGEAAAVYRRAQAGRWFADAARQAPEVFATSDQQSFFVAWKAPGSNPTHWIVSLHGSRGFATDDFALWHPALAGREVGFLALQWWLGSDDAPRAYLAPLQIYRELDLALQRLGVAPGRAMLHGFSRGSANAYAVAAIDAGRGRRYFSLAVASSGGVATDYPPTRAILSGAYGDRPLRGTRWVTAAGARDPDPERDGIPAMRRTAAWLEAQGAAVVERIEDPAEGHGALQRNPANLRRVIDIFLAGPR